ncbi:hypothetical protein EC957_011601 [Mortierella hygrophila]|uniref:Uncharacterized protein n=1 Tax=Mortierella hygrophila TaxID=979708 RepID=A0A9P6F8I4_9FUNG|nr:hypothetical protein EC957_011601 [Mortierella hygrophila]
MGLVGVKGKITLGPSLNNGCLLYMTMEGDVATYNNGFCLFPIVAAAVTAGFSLVFLIFLSMVLHRKDEFSPRGLSMVMVFLSGLLALLSFAVCGEIGLGLNKGCRILGNEIDSCRSTNNFRSLYGAQITAGIMAGFWIIIMVLEVFQLKGRPHLLATNTVDIVGRTTVIPSTKMSKSSHGVPNSNITNPNYVPTSTSSTNMASAAPTPAPAPANVHQDGTYQQQQPEMTYYQMNDNNNSYDQAQQQYSQATPQPQYQQGQPTPQVEYQGAQQTPQLAYQQVQPSSQIQGAYQQDTPVVQNQMLPQPQDVYQPQHVYQPPPITQSAHPLQQLQSYQTYSTPVSELYPPQTGTVDTLPSSSGVDNSRTL